jgi:acetolactate synthase-1/2/3 large subunit
LHEAIKQADLIIAIGHDTIEKPTNLLEPGKTKLVHINFTEAEFNELYHPDLQIVGDIGNTLRRLYEAEITTANRDLDTLVVAANKAKQQLAETIHQAMQNKQITPARVAATLRTELQDDAIICLDNGLYKVRFARNFPCYHPNTLLLDNALATM